LTRGWNDAWPSTKATGTKLALSFVASNAYSITDAGGGGSATKK
jgi:hypothetical protein